MPAQRRSSETTPPPPQPLEEKDDDSLQHNQNENGEQADDEDDRHSDGSSSSTDEEEAQEYILLKLSDIRKEVQCPICLGIIRKTRTVMECLHRFCRECIDKSMRLGNNECPACRTHCASRRSLRDDPNYDALIAAIYPDIDKYEEEELAFREEEKARNKQIQASIAQTLRRQSEALGRKRTARSTSAAFGRRSHSTYRTVRGRRSRRSSEQQGSDEEDDANGNDGGKDSSSADEHTPDVKSRRYKRYSGGRFSQASGAGNSDTGYDENDAEVNRESLGASAGLVGSSEILGWGKGGIRSNTRHGGPGGGNGKFARNSRLSKMMDSLRCSEGNTDGWDVSLMLVSLHEEEIPGLQRPYLSCKPTLSIRYLCQYVALQTSMQADQIQIWAIKALNKSHNFSQGSDIAASISDQSKGDVSLLEEDKTLGEIHSILSLSGRNLVLAYGIKLQSLET